MRPDNPSDPALIRLQLASSEATLSDEGVGPPVVCVHGLPGSARDFRWLAPALTERGLRCIRVELPGFGSCRARVPAQTEGMAGHVLSVVDALRIERPVLLGHSYGGAVALALAAQHPDRVGHLALVSAMGLRRHRMFRRSAWGFDLVRLAHVPILGKPVRDALQVGFRKAGFRHGVSSDSVVRSLEILSNVDFGKQAVAWSRVRAPTAVVWCADDALIEDEITQDFARRLPPGPRLRFESGGHIPQKSHAVEIAEALAEWLSAAAGPEARVN